MRALGDLWRGITRSPKRAGLALVSSFSVMFTSAKTITAVFPSIKFDSKAAIGIMALVAFGFALKRVWKPSKVSFHIANCNTNLEILFGDIFEQEGIRVIAAGEYFDSEIGKAVSDKSLHGIFIKQCFGGQPETFDRQIDKELENVPFEVTAKTIGKNKAYPIGTTTMVEVASTRYLLFALTKAEPDTCKAYADVTMMWTALDKAWGRARVEAGGHPVNVPLIGSGPSGIGLPTRDLLNMLVLSAITETKEQQVTTQIRIVLHRSKFDDLDLRDVKQYWSEN